MNTKYLIILTLVSSAHVYGSDSNSHLDSGLDGPGMNSDTSLGIEPADLSDDDDRDGTQDQLLPNAPQQQMIQIDTSPEKVHGSDSNSHLDSGLDGAGMNSDTSLGIEPADFSDDDRDGTQDQLLPDAPQQQMIQIDTLPEKVHSSDSNSHLDSGLNGPGMNSDTSLGIEPADFSDDDRNGTQDQFLPDAPQQQMIQIDTSPEKDDDAQNNQQTAHPLPDATPKSTSPASKDQAPQKQKKQGSAMAGFWNLSHVSKNIVPYLDAKDWLMIRQLNKKQVGLSTMHKGTLNNWPYMWVDAGPNTHLFLPARHGVHVGYIQQIEREITAQKDHPFYAEHVTLTNKNDIDFEFPTPAIGNFGKRNITIATTGQAAHYNLSYWIANSVSIKGTHDITLETVGNRGNSVYRREPGQDMETVKRVWLKSDNEHATVRYNSLVHTFVGGARCANIPVAVTGGFPSVDITQNEGRRKIEAKGDSVILKFEKGYVVRRLLGLGGNTLGSWDLEGENEGVGLASRGLDVNAKTNTLESALSIETLVMKPRDACKPSSIHLDYLPEDMNITINVVNKDDKVFSFGLPKAAKTYSARDVDACLKKPGYTAPVTYKIVERVIDTGETTLFTNRKPQKHQEEERKE